MNKEFSFISWLIQNLKELKKKEFWISLFFLFIIYGIINIVLAFFSPSYLLIFVAMTWFIGILIIEVTYLLQIKKHKSKSLPLPPPPIEQTEQLCSICHKKMVFVSQYNKWYCQKCMRYQ